MGCPTNRVPSWYGPTVRVDPARPQALTAVAHRRQAYLDSDYYTPIRAGHQIIWGRTGRWGGVGKGGSAAGGRDASLEVVTATATLRLSHGRVNAALNSDDPMDSDWSNTGLTLV